MPWACWALLAAALVVRLPGIARPLLGDFATKNVVYAMIARNWALGRAPAALPTLDCLVGGERSLHLVELPVSAYVSGALWKALGGNLDVWGRLTSVSFSVASVAFLYLLVRRWHSETAAMAAAAVLAFSPVSIIYGQSFMLEASVVCLTLFTLWSAQNYADSRRRRWLLLSAAALALLLLTKVYMAVLLLPLLVVVRRSSEVKPVRALLASKQWHSGWHFRRLGGVALASRQCARAGGSLTVSATKELSSTRSCHCLLASSAYWAALFLAALPVAAWYGYVLALTAPGQALAEHVFYSTRQSAAAHVFPSPLLSSAQFYFGMLADLGGVALTPVALGLAAIGLTHPQWRRHIPWLASMAVLIVLLPRKFAEMNYYYLVILPPLCVLAGLGWEKLSQQAWLPKWSGVAVIIAFAIASARFTIKPAFVTPSADHAVAAAGAAVERLAKREDRVVALHGSAPDLLYYCDRAGWALDPRKPEFQAKLAECCADGAKWLVILDAARLATECSRLELVQRGDGFRIYRLPAANANTESLTVLEPGTAAR